MSPKMERMYTQLTKCGKNLQDQKVRQVIKMASSMKNEPL